MMYKSVSFWTEDVAIEILYTVVISAQFEVLQLLLNYAWKIIITHIQCLKVVQDSV